MPEAFCCLPPLSLPSALPAVIAMALANARGPGVGCTGPFPLNTGHSQGVSSKYALEADISGILLRLGDDEGGSTWSLVPFQTEEGFVRLGGCGRALRYVCACVCVCISLSSLAAQAMKRLGGGGGAVAAGRPEGSSGVSSIHVQSRDPEQRISSELESLLQAIPDFSGMLHT